MSVLIDVLDCYVGVACIAVETRQSVSLYRVCFFFFLFCCFFFFNDTATTEIYTLSLHDALPICSPGPEAPGIADWLIVRYKICYRPIKSEPVTCCDQSVIGSTDQSVLSDGKGSG